ncbi:MAG: hypothetical protein LUQ09_08665 [Methanomassiliicoccales archaeon]|nr:hypothetical protein [Methanomassiliicoccales archaeon]
MEKNGTSIIDDGKGVYMVLYTGKERPEFLEVGTGGHFKERDPNVPIHALGSTWVDGAMVVYIGKTGSSLKGRIRAYMRFGQGKRVSHWGGRYIWQMVGSRELLVCWRPIPGSTDPRSVEASLLKEFEKQYGKLPFANPVH